jgi:hypothetical protein
MAEDHMQINQRIVGDAALVEVISDIVANGGDALLKDKVSSLRQQGCTRVVVDLIRYIQRRGGGRRELLGRSITGAPRCLDATRKSVLTGRKKPALPFERAGIGATRRDDPRSGPPADFQCYFLATRRHPGVDLLV